MGNFAKVSDKVVSTHSRLKAAVTGIAVDLRLSDVSTHSRLKAAANRKTPSVVYHQVSTHSRLKAAVGRFSEIRGGRRFQHTAA